MLVALCLWPISAAAAPPASSTSPKQAWSQSDGADPQVVRAGISVPRQAGVLKLTTVTDLGHDGIDDVAQYASSDEAISGTIFLYFPTLADTGLTFLATDETIRRRFGGQTRIADDRLVEVGGVASAGRRVIYTGASEGRRATAAMFVRAGGWIIVLRVSGPASRAAQIGASLDALAAGLHFSARSSPVAAHVIAVSPCAAREEREAPVTAPSAGQLGATLLLIAAGVPRDQKEKPLRDVLGRVPDRLCLERNASWGESVALTYRVVDKPRGLFAPKAFHLVGDAGFMVEVTAASNDPEQSLMVRHTIGRLLAAGFFRGEPSIGQLETMAGKGGAKVVADATLTPEGDAQISIYCEATKEGCAAAKPQAASGTASSR